MPRQPSFRSPWLTLALVSLTVCPLLARTWKSADGKFTVEAEFVEATGPNVKLRKADGKEITVMMSQLSQADRDFVIAEKKKVAKNLAVPKPIGPAGGSGFTPANLPLGDAPAKPKEREDEEEPPFDPAAEAKAKAELEKLGAKCTHALLESDRPIFKVEWDGDLYKSGDVAKALPYLKQLPSLRDLHLGREATDADFKVVGQLKECKRLEEVVATFSAVTDAGFLELKNLPRLECINVIGAEKTTKDGALKALKAMPQLQVIYLDTDDGVQRPK